MPGMKRAGAVVRLDSGDGIGTLRRLTVGGMVWEWRGQLVLALALRWGTAETADVERVGGTTSVGDTATTTYLSLVRSASSPSV